MEFSVLEDELSKKNMMLSRNILKNIFDTILLNRRFVRNGEKRSNILYDYANVFRPEIESELEHLAVQTSRNKSLQINYEIEEQRKRRKTIRYHMLKRKYVIHPNDVKVDLYVKNHMQFLHKNYPKRWTVEMLADSFNETVENVRLILSQRTTRRLRVRPRSPTTLFGIKDGEKSEQLIREHIIKRDIGNSEQVEVEEPVDHHVLAEANRILPKKRPSENYLKKANDGFFSNVISSSDQDQQNERDISMKTKLLTSSPTLLDRINRLHINSNNTPHNTYTDDQTSEIDNKRMNIIEKMQETNDSLADMYEQRQKYLDRTKFSKIK